MIHLVSHPSQLYCVPADILTSYSTGDLELPRTSSLGRSQCKGQHRGTLEEGLKNHSLIVLLLTSCVILASHLSILSLHFPSYKIGIILAAQDCYKD